MGKIDYSKAEKELEEALKRSQIKQLAEGKSITSSRAAEYYGLSETTVRPVPDDPVEAWLSEEAAQEEVPEQEDEESISVEGTPTEDMIIKKKKKSSRIPPKVAQSVPEIAPSEAFLEKLSPLQMLKQHLLWMKHHFIEKHYAKIGTTKEEVLEFVQSNRLSDIQLQRIREINSKAEKFKKELLKKQGKESDSGIISEEQKKHKRKRFNVREGWIPL